MQTPYLGDIDAKQYMLQLCQVPQTVQLQPE